MTSPKTRCRIMGQKIGNLIGYPECQKAISSRKLAGQEFLTLDVLSRLIDINFYAFNKPFRSPSMRQALFITGS